ncbi:lysine 6-dehydrogenase [Scopulibacillus darangshiensis]|uniref:Lysine 6-dehydrogenase n=1 Tax=Scopulibacillus darangshiensis TaxID=442528 RepID=A0A4R2NI45_9BACL|nr:saccharopine dehydrogenase C-terminal domain-containing protein [Scopulibacillus darangshiensis]TCP21159.1 lysine 6-dehydrogenase [Scopulibacillus darangshiensis]
MDAVVLGTGMIGTTVVRELASCANISKVTAVDAVQNSVKHCVEAADNAKVKGRVAALENVEAISEILKEADVAVACLPHSLSLMTIKAAVSAKCHLVDLVGSDYHTKMALDEAAKEAGVVIVPGSGVAPGITNFLAAQGIDLLDEADEAVMICGGIPRNPLPPLWYQVVFRLESVMGLYSRPALAVEKGELVTLPALSGLESVRFPDPVGDCEAVITDAHSAAYTLKDKVNRLYEKTVRYKGHWEKMGVLAELGFLDDTPIDVDGISISPRKFSTAVLEPQMKGQSGEDITVLRVVTKGKKNGEQTWFKWEMVDFFDHERGITSMAKTTAMPAMVMAQWIAAGKVTERGVIPIEKIIIGDHFKPFLSALRARGIDITFESNRGAAL